jgi:hypothetical protein
MKPIIKSFKSVLQGLVYDQELVNEIKKANIDKECLYNHLSSGRITLEEYVQAVK